MVDEKKYVGPYKVVKLFRKSGRKQVIERGLSREEAMRIVNAFPDSPNSMVFFDKQFSSEKYYV